MITPSRIASASARLPAASAVTIDALVMTSASADSAMSGSALSGSALSGSASSSGGSVDVSHERALQATSRAMSRWFNGFAVVEEIGTGMILLSPPVG